MSDADSESELDGARPLVSKSKSRSQNSTASVRRQNKFRRKRRLLCFGAVAVAAALAVLCLIIFTDDDVDYNWDPNNESPPPSWYAPRRRFNILLWQWDQNKTLKYSDCVIVNGNAIDIAELYNRTFDAVIFNATADYNAAPLPLRRLPHQYYVYALEMPLSAADRQRVNASDLAQFFNLTLSYTLDSDIPWLMHEWFDFKQRTIAPRLQPHWLDPAADTSKKVHYGYYNRTKSLLGLAVMDAPCNHTRNKLLQDIQRSMNVDVYGDCGPLTCPFDCKMLAKSNNGTMYKFYFAFEDEFCTDYVSRYFYLALYAGIVPVVLGGANYTRFAPPHSYIEADAFQSVHQLVQYLQYLHVHFDEYQQYFAWLNHYFLLPAKEPYQAVCSFLQRSGSNSAGTKTSVTTGNFTAWWANSECRTDTLPPF